MEIRWPYARLSRDILPYPQIGEEQSERGSRKAGRADPRVNEAALPALQAGAADRAKPTVLRKLLALIDCSHLAVRHVGSRYYFSLFIPAISPPACALMLFSQMQRAS